MIVGSNPVLYIYNPYTVHMCVYLSALVEADLHLSFASELELPPQTHGGH